MAKKSPEGTGGAQAEVARWGRHGDLEESKTDSKVVHQSGGEKEPILDERGTPIALREALTKDERK